MKTLKTVTIVALVATFGLVTVSPVWAHPAAFPHAHMNNPPKQAFLPPGGIKCPGCSPAVPPGGGSWGCKGPNCGKKPAPTPPKGNNPAPPQVNNYYQGSRGASWGAFAGGTALGLMMGAVANQPRQTTQPQVVHVQQPNGDTTARYKELELEIERERAKARALELELERLRAERQE